MPFGVAILVFIIASLAYFSPVLEGKKIQQSDITQFIGSSKEIKDHREKYDEEPYWTSATFGGMPAYSVSAYYPHDYIKKVDKLLRFLPRPADYLFLYFISFFVLLMTLKVDWKLAILGALGFGLSTYLIIILGVGHNAKAHAIAYFPLVLSGILLVFQNKYVIGFLLTAFGMALELHANHIQMTYYLFFLVLILGIVKLVEVIKSKEFKPFVKQMSILIVAVILALGTNATSLMATQEYAKESTRSKSELTINPDGSEKEASSGLSYDYITEYSYGQLETLNLFVPRLMGGTSQEQLEDSALQSFLQDAMRQGLSANDVNYVFRLSSMYWGEQPIVAAPAYIGAIFIFFFVLAIFLVKGPYKTWLVAATVFSIVLSWGYHVGFITNFFIDYVPLYNKFRAVSSIQVIAELTIPLMAILGVKAFLSKDIDESKKLRALKFATYIVGGFALLLVVGAGEFFSFTRTPIDEQIDEQLPGYLDALISDRKSLMRGDAVRTLTLVVLVAALMWLYLKQKIKEVLLIVAVGVLVVYDLAGVDKRYVNDSKFKSARKVNKPFVASEIDKEILKDRSHYRVANFSKNVMVDGGTSYFHNSIGGYHAAKPRRYQELYDFHIAKGNAEVLNMLNTKYIIGADQQGQLQLEVNNNANGNAWFVRNLQFVENANEEITQLDSLNTRNSAILQEKFKNELSDQYAIDSTATISLTSYKANQLEYKSNSNLKQFAVFSEVYYPYGWNAYIDGELTEIYQVNYVLRGVEVPAGAHKIVFKFEPQVIKTGSTISLISFALLILIPVGWSVFENRSSKE